jgi:outer membrane protein assembly factor BamD (BamD/ComL family)
MHIKEQPAMWSRFGVRWTPTILILAPDGKEQHRIEGFLPADDFLAQLELGLGHMAVGRREWQAAEREFTKIVDELPETDAAPEALYWSGVAKYSCTHDATALKETSRKLKSKYERTSWAKRASVWG